MTTYITEAGRKLLEKFWPRVDTVEPPRNPDLSESPPQPRYIPPADPPDDDDDDEPTSTVPVNHLFRPTLTEELLSAIRDVGLDIEARTLKARLDNDEAAIACLEQTAEIFSPIVAVVKKMASEAATSSISDGDSK